MNQIESILETVTEYLQKLEGSPAVLLVVLSAIVLGYVLKRFKTFPNDAIPIVVILWGGVIYPLIADANNDLTLRVWLVRNVAIGLITGFVAWVFHNQILKRFLNKFSSRDETAEVTNSPK